MCQRSLYLARSKPRSTPIAIVNTLELKIPPPVIALVAGLAMWLSARHVPALALELSGRLAICSALIIAGGVFDISGLLAFRKAKTTINPLKPDNTSNMVIIGIYRYSRNPMYFGLLLVLSGWATYLSHILPFLFLPLFVAYLNRFQIAPEERVLSAKFGPEYSSYKQSVRQWI